ncbi:MAG: hypothetical protein ABJP45_00195 [Cyclobacteriaceae bacterium]
MKPLSDKELKELLGKRISNLEPIESDHLWSGIEGSLPKQSSSNILGTLVKSGLALGTLAILFFAYKMVNTTPSLIEIEDQTSKPKNVAKSTAMTAEKISSIKTPTVAQLVEEATPHELEVDKVTVIDTEVDPLKDGLSEDSADQVEESAGPNVVISTEDPSETEKEVQRVNTHHSSKTEIPIMVSQSTEVQVEKLNERKKSPRFLPSILTEVRSAAISEPILILLEEQSQHSEAKGVWFWSGSSYLSFHTLSPSRLDENSVQGDPDRQPSLGDRFGISFSVGRERQATSRLSLRSHLSLDYYNTRFNFLVANAVSPLVSIENQRLDLGLNVGIGYRVGSSIRNGTVHVDMGGRVRAINFSSESQGYKPKVLTYRLSYLIDVSTFSIGPTFGSLLTSRDYDGYGEISPSIYGFIVKSTIRSK